jgi:hypothetical protein
MIFQEICINQMVNTNLINAEKIMYALSLQQAGNQQEFSF